MKEDPLVAEIRAVRHRIFEEFGHDTRALVEHYRKLEMKYADRMFPSGKSMEPGQPTKAANA